MQARWFASLAALLYLLPPSDALACGGFFCSQTPVLQTAERVVFEVEGNEVTAYVQLQYIGDDFNFAWIVPVPSTPEIEVGVGQAMFDALERQTQPQFTVTSVSPDAAAVSLGCGFGGDPALMSRYVPAPEVDVYKQERVGPYDVAVLDAENAADLNNWLGLNGYTLVTGSDAIVQEYLDQDMKLLALKLTPGEDVAAIEPIKLKYTDSRGCAAIPVKLTAIAATPGLEIVTWVFGSAPAKPMNYDHAQIDFTRVLTRRDYRVALDAAVDEFDGQAFVTEYAQSTSRLDAAGDENLEGLLNRHSHVTRLRTFIDPAQMTVDPEFTTDPELPLVSNEIEIGRGTMPVSAGFMMSAIAIGLFVRRRWRR